MLLVLQTECPNNGNKAVWEDVLSKLKFGDRSFQLPKSRPLRLVIGVLLVILGTLGFLPVIGFWMIPLGIIVLSIDVPPIRRARRRFVIWREHRKRDRDRKKG